MEIFLDNDKSRTQWHKGNPSPETSSVDAPRIVPPMQSTIEETSEGGDQEKNSEELSKEQNFCHPLLVCMIYVHVTGPIRRWYITSRTVPNQNYEIIWSRRTRANGCRPLMMNLMTKLTIESPLKLKGELRTRSLYQRESC